MGVQDYPCGAWAKCWITRSSLLRTCVAAEARRGLWMACMEATGSIDADFLHHDIAGEHGPDFVFELQALVGSRRMACAEDRVGAEVHPNLRLEGGLGIDPADDPESLAGERARRGVDRLLHCEPHRCRYVVTHLHPRERAEEGSYSFLFRVSHAGDYVTVGHLRVGQSGWPDVRSWISI